jgi:hypothetical protein
MKLLFEEGIAGEHNFHRLYKYGEYRIGIWVQDTHEHSMHSRNVTVALFSKTTMKWENLKTRTSMIESLEATIEKLLMYAKYFLD